MDFRQFTRTNEVDPNPKLDRAKGILKGQVVRMSFEGGNLGSTLGILPQKGVLNYLGRKTTVKGARRFGETQIQNLYPGISARYYFDQGSPRYDLIVHTGADPSQIAMKFEHDPDRSALKLTTESSDFSRIIRCRGNRDLGPIFMQILSFSTISK